MKSALTPIIIITLCIFCAACIPSLNEFYSADDVYFDRNLLGTWTDGDGKESWTFASGDRLTYRLTHIDRTGASGDFEATLFKIDGKSFLDITPARAKENGSDFYRSQFLAVHTLLAVSIEGASGKIAGLNGNKIKAMLAKDRNLLAHSYVDGELILTDSTKNLRAFLRVHAKHPDLFDESSAVVRTEKK